jgi:hypothetical protein
MLSNPILGVLALGILWVNTLLVAAAALKEAAALAARRRAMRPLPPGEEGLGLVEGRVVRGDGRTGALAGHRVDQVGRAGPGEGRDETILFQDRSYSGEVYGGAVAIAGDREIAVAPRIDAEVWLPAAEVREAAACPSAARFDEAYPHARKARGYSRTVEAMIRPGARVWLLGELRPAAGDRLELSPALVAALDPRAFCRSRAALLVAFALVAVAVAGACTAVALVPPAFGTISKIGGALCLAFFLLIQPAGTAARDAVRPPGRATLRGSWRRRALGDPELERSA